VKKTHDYVHHYRGYWSDGGKCRIRIYREDGQVPVVICSQLVQHFQHRVRQRDGRAGALPLRPRDEDYLRQP
jgi:hypothetical protein